MREEASWLLKRDGVWYGVLVGAAFISVWIANQGDVITAFIFWASTTTLLLLWRPD